MHALVADVFSWGAEVIVAIQALSTPALDLFFTLVTMLGQEPLYVLLYPLAFWCVGKRFGLRTTGLILTTLLINEALKRLVAEPRPYLVHPEIQARLVYSGFSFPSGHAQLSATLWPALATRVRRSWFWALAVVMIAAVSLSRVYLGVHYPHDVVAGILVGLAVGALYAAAEVHLRDRLASGRICPMAFVALAAGAVALALLHGQDVLLATGGAVGAAAGWALDERTPRARPLPGALPCAARFLLGLGALGALYLAVEGWAPPAGGAPRQIALTLALYAALGLAATWGVPWAFARLGLMVGHPPVARPDSKEKGPT